MIIYRGYYHFMKGRGGMLKSDLTVRGVLSVMPGVQPRRYFIQVNGGDELEDQVKTVLHEFAHIGLEHGNSLFVEEDSKIEEQAERETMKFYDRSSLLVYGIREILKSI